jgi:hypothetical protein
MDNDNPTLANKKNPVPPDTTPQQEEMFVWLDNLRESGIVNMFGSAPMLQEAFNLSKAHAKMTVLKWMQTYGDRHPKDE